MRPLMWISCVFFPLAAIPQNYQHFFLWNPIVHALELIRSGWIAGFDSPSVSWEFLIGVTIVMLTFSMSCYRLTHKKLIAIS